MQTTCWGWRRPSDNCWIPTHAGKSSHRTIQKRKHVVSADASSFGLGVVLMQEQPSDEMRPEAYGSRSMTDTESRYAQIDKEALAITWALEQWTEFFIGMKFNAQTGHKPLIRCFPPS